MNEKTRVFCRRLFQRSFDISRGAWTEPRRFFLWMTFLSLVGLAMGFVLDNLGAIHIASPLTQKLAAFLLLVLILGLVAGVIGFVLSWIPPVYRLFVWILRRRFFVLGCVVTLIALFYAVEDWRGKKAWQDFKRDREAQGEEFDIVAMAPPPVPDDQNFAMQPIWVEHISATMGAKNGKSWYGDKVEALGHTNFARRLEMPTVLSESSSNRTNTPKTWETSQRTDLKHLQDYYRQLAGTTNFFPVANEPKTPAEDVLIALSRYDSTIEELRRASRLPHARFPVTYGDEDPAGILLPHLGALKHCVDTLQLRAVAALQAGQPDKALEDIKLMLRLNEATRIEPILISHLVSISMWNITVQPVWEGLAEHRWNESHLAALDSEISRFDFLADYQFAMRGERAFGVGVIEHLRRRREQIGPTFDMIHEAQSVFDSSQDSLGEAANTGFFHFIPSGWFERNKVAIARMQEEYLLRTIDLKTRTASPLIEKKSTEAFNRLPFSPYNWFGRLLLPTLSNVTSKSARAQFGCDAARIAISLERYRLANGEFPEELSALSPNLMAEIPHDVIGGQPLKYRRNDDGSFVLYSVGWNEKDDGGKVVVGKEQKVDIKQGDWVWRYPQK